MKNEMMKIILEQKQLILDLQKKTNLINIHKKKRSSKPHFLNNQFNFFEIEKYKLVSKLIS